MNPCPKCGTPVPDSAFGLYTCAQCKVVLTVDFNGNVSFDDIAPAASTSSNVTPNITRVETRLKEPDYLEAISVEEADQAEGLETVHEETIDRTTVLRVEDENAEPYRLPEREEISGSADFADVVNYGNSDVSTASEGNLLYDILIKGIDSEDLRVVVKEALIDNRFGWNAEDVFGKLRRGSLLLSRINAVKASVLLSRLKSYPLEISWVQNGIYKVDTKN
jgi:hypothetical protein